MLDIVPQPKIIEYKDEPGFYNDRRISGVVLSGTDDPRIIRAAQKAFNNVKVNLKNEEEGFLLTVNYQERLISDIEICRKIKDKHEGYVLTVKNNTIAVFSYYLNGLFYGIRTVKQIMENYNPFPELTVIDWPDIEMRSMYFDLRQTYPRFDRLIQYIEDFADYKINTLIIEYEDKLPFEKHSYLRHEEFAFSEDQFELIKATARDHFIEIIPLQQSFGHLEYVLKHERHMHLRETFEDIGELCPSRPGALELSLGLIDEIVRKHSEARYIHIGCDEVWSLCKCEKCKELNGNSRARTFITFVNKLIDFVFSQGKIPVIWHDMLETCSDDELKLLDNRAIVMLWLYSPDSIEPHICDMTNRLRKLGVEVFGASSVRCYDGKVDQNYPVAANRVSNITQWVNAAGKLGIKGIVSTNWATHFALGYPYGIFETSWYLNVFSAELYWNRDADKKSFLSRFLCVFHGMDPNEADKSFRGLNAEDYYQIIGELADIITKNWDIAEMIGIVRKYESGINGFPLERCFYRVDFFKDEIEKVSIRVKLKRKREILQSAKLEMAEKLRCFMPEQMASMYMHSRFFMEEFYEQSLYKLLD